MMAGLGLYRAPDLDFDDGSDDGGDDDRLDFFLSDFEDAVTDEFLNRHVVRGRDMNVLERKARRVAAGRRHVEVSTMFLMTPADEAALLQEIRQKNRNGSFDGDAPGIQVTKVAFRYYECNRRTGMERIGVSRFRYNVIRNGGVRIIGHLEGLEERALPVLAGRGGRRILPARRVGGRRFRRPR